MAFYRNKPQPIPLEYACVLLVGGPLDGKECVVQKIDGRYHDLFGSAYSLPHGRYRRYGAWSKGCVRKMHYVGAEV